LTEGPGRTYGSACRWVNRAFPMSPERRAAREAARKKEWDAEVRRYKDERARIDAALASVDEGTTRHSELMDKLARASERREYHERKFKQPDFHRAVELTGLGLNLDEVLHFASWLSSMTFAVAFLLWLVLLLALGRAHALYLFLSLPAVFVSPLVIFAVTANYPELLANRLRSRTLGQAPELITYMSMSLRLTPAMGPALAFAANNTSEPMGSGLRKVIWNVYTRKFPRLEDSLRDFAEDWGQWNEDLKRSIYSVWSATLEGTGEGLNRALDKANAIVLSGTRKRMEEFSSSLAGPSMVLFALGLLLPLVIGAMLPLMTVEMPSMSFDAGTSASTVNGAANPLPIVLLMDVTFPVAAFFYAHNILGKKPGSRTLDVGNAAPVKRSRLAAASIAIAAVLALPFFALASIPRLYAALSLLWGVGMALAFYFVTSSSAIKKQRDRQVEIENEFPDALFTIGTRIGEGAPFERAVMDTGADRAGSPLGKLLTAISLRLQLSHDTREEVLSTISSPTVRASLQAVSEAVRKDSRSAGKTTSNISQFLRDREKVDHDIRIQLSSVTDTMRSTALFFAPITVGITVALYSLLASEFSRLSQAPMLAPWTLLLVMGVYLVAMVLVTLYFCHYIRWGNDWAGYKHSVGTGLPVALAIFTLSVFGGMMLMG